MSGGRFALSGCLKISVESCWFFIAKHALQEQHSWELANNYANLAAKSVTADLRQNIRKSLTA